MESFIHGHSHTLHAIADFLKLDAGEEEAIRQGQAPLLSMPPSPPDLELYEDFSDAMQKHAAGFQGVTADPRGVWRCERIKDKAAVTHERKEAGILTQEWSDMVKRRFDLWPDDDINLLLRLALQALGDNPRNIEQQVLQRSRDDKSSDVNAYLRKGLKAPELTKNLFGDEGPDRMLFDDGVHEFERLETLSVQRQQVAFAAKSRTDEATPEDYAQLAAAYRWEGWHLTFSPYEEIWE